MRNRPSVFIPLVAAAAAGFAMLCAGQPAHAGVYIEFPPGVAKGNVRNPSLPPGEWIKADSFQMGVARRMSTPVGASGKRESSAPSVSEMVVTLSDSTLIPELFANATTGRPATIRVALTSAGNNDDAAKTGALGGNDSLLITLDNAMISNFSVSSGGDRASASLSLNFTKITLSTNGKSEGPGTVTWDIASARAE